MVVTNPKKVLVVEDEMIVAADIRARLESLGYTTAGSCSSGEKAIALAEQKAPDLVLMDIHLAGKMDGVTAAQEIHQRFQIPVIFLTAYSEDATIERAKLTEPFGYILKPFDDRSLKTAIELALYRHQVDYEHTTASQLLEICNQAATTSELMGNLVSFFQHITGCEAIGVRLEQGGDFPFVETTGFGSEFLRTERSLIRLVPSGSSGARSGDSLEQPRLACLCGDVLQERFDPSLPWFTSEGSFWTSDFAAHPGRTVTNPDGTETPRACHQEGYRSITLVPLKHHGRMLGLFQFSDRRAGRFTLDRIEHLQRLVDYVSIALSKHLSEDSLRESEARFRALFQATSDAVFACRILPDNRLGRIFQANEVACRMYGYSLQEFLLLEACRLQAPENVADLPTLVERMLAGDSVLFRRIHLHRDGRRIPVEINARFFDYQGSPAILSTVRDLTERLREEEERLQNERQAQQDLRSQSLGVLAGGIAHDFNNLLTGIMGNAELGKLGISTDHPVRRNLDEILSSSKKAGDLCQKMLAYAGRSHYVMESLELSGLVESSTQELQTTVGTLARNGALSIRLAGRLPMARGSRPDLRQVLVNLVANAAEAIGDNHGIISVTTGTAVCGPGDFADAPVGADSPPGTYIVLEVTDTGCGMDQKTLERLFEPFFTTKFLGRGLGMPAVLGIVRSHKGAMTIVTGPGKGTAVRVFLPALPETAGGAYDAPSLSAQTPAAHRRILVVDDDPFVRLLGGKLLAELGYQVITAGSGQEAVRICTEQRSAIDLVLLDLAMEDMDGAATFHSLQEIDPDIAIVIASGHTGSRIRQRISGKALKGILEKPYTAETLLAMLERVFGKA